MEISINKKNPQYCSKKCKYYSRYSASFTCDKYQCKLKMLFRVEGVKRLRCEECITDFGV
jgi:hypothetical protein